MESNADGQEIYSSAGQGRTGVTSSTPIINPITPLTHAAYVEEEDDISVHVPPGAPCQRRGCYTNYISDEISRLGDGEGTVCVYHPAPVSYYEPR